jgi:hypothetical protein
VRVIPILWIKTCVEAVPFILEQDMLFGKLQTAISETETCSLVLLFGRRCQLLRNKLEANVTPVQVGAMKETFDLAQKRLVEPRQIDPTAIFLLFAGNSNGRQLLRNLHHHRSGSGQRTLQIRSASCLAQ